MSQTKNLCISASRHSHSTLPQAILIIDSNFDVVHTYFYSRSTFEHATQRQEIIAMGKKKKLK